MAVREFPPETNIRQNFNLITNSFLLAVLLCGLNLLDYVIHVLAQILCASSGTSPCIIGPDTTSLGISSVRSTESPPGTISPNVAVVGTTILCITTLCKAGSSTTNLSICTANSEGKSFTVTPWYI